jgi:hypothetical protein
MLGTFFTITNEMMTTMIGYIGDVFTDLAPLLLLIIGVSVAMLVIGFIIRAFTK